MYYSDYMILAERISDLSDDPNYKIGTIAVRDNKIISLGFNSLLRHKTESINVFNDKELKNKYIVHSEMNCIYNALRQERTLIDSDLYIYGLSPCHDCAKAIIQTQIKNVYYINHKENHKWIESQNIAIELFKEAEVTINEKINRI